MTVESVRRFRQRLRGKTVGHLLRKTAEYSQAAVAAKVRPVVTIEGIRMKPGRAASPAVQAALRANNYEREELAALREALRPGDRVVEIGAGLGLLSTFCAQVAGSENVFAFEANPGLREAIHATHRLNGVSPRLEICLVGPDDRDQVPFFVGKRFWDSSIVQTRATSTRTMLRQRSIGGILGECRPTVLIMDVEGGEADLVPALLACPPQQLPDRLIMEVHPAAIGPDRVAELGVQLRAAEYAIEEDGDTWIARRPASVEPAMPSARSSA